MCIWAHVAIWFDNFISHPILLCMYQRVNTALLPYDNASQWLPSPLYALIMLESKRSKPPAAFSCLRLLSHLAGSVVRAAYKCPEILDGVVPVVRSHIP